MRFITTRELLTSFKSLMPPPIEGYCVTNKGKPIAVVLPYQKGVEMSQELEEKTSEEETGGLEDIVDDGTHTIANAPPKVGWCEGHFEKGATYPLEECELENIDGEIVWKKKLCPDCIKRFQAQVEREGGKLRKK